MNKLKISFLCATLMAVILFLSSCVKDKDDTVFYITAAPLTAAQTIPPSNATSSGTIDANYSRGTKTLSYKVSWTNLMDTATLLHVHGLADAGAIAIAPYPNGIIQTFTRTSTPALSPKKDASFSGTLYIDGTVLKEEDLLAGKYYIDLHTKAKPAGELRGQLVFDK